MNVLLLANGPGEAWGWAKPLWEQLILRGHQVKALLLPCPFAGGGELDALSTLGMEVSRFGGALQTLWAGRRLCREWRPDWVVQLGGDLMFGRRFAVVAGSSLASYSYAPKRGLKFCDARFSARPNDWGAVPVGDLAFESLSAPRSILWQAPAGRRLLVLPGSRPAIRRAALEYLRPLPAFLSERLGVVELRVPLSPFAGEEEIGDWEEAGFRPFLTDLGALTEGADFALTQPGTNTLQLMSRGVPFLAAVPLDFAELVPLSGLKGLCPRSWRRRLLRFLMSRRKGFVAWPNRLAGMELCPELVGDFSFEALARALVDQLSDEPGRKRQSEGLLALARQACRASEGIVVSLERMRA